MTVLELPSVQLPSPLNQPNVPDDLLVEIEASQRRRLEHFLAVERNGLIEPELESCRRDIFYWFTNYAWTYDPRNADVEESVTGQRLPTWLPFDLWPRQIELIRWFDFLLKSKSDGALKKSRDIGFTWLAAAYAWHKFRFVEGFATTFGSRVAMLVDQLGDPTTIFEKIRLIYKSVPKWMLPQGFDPREHDKFMLMINPANGATIRGEGGDEMGRGGRSSLYFIDEAAKLERADRVDAATSANTDVRIWGSSINPQNENNLFQRKYTSFPADRVFRFHYSDDPRKTTEWAAKKRGSLSPEIWAAEYEIDDSYSVEDICIPASWVESSRKLKKLLKEKRGTTLEPKREGIAGGDVGGGKAQSVVIARFGVVVTEPSAWQNPDTIDTAFKMLDYCQDLKLPPRADQYIPRIKSLRFDSIGIGQGVSAALKRNPRPGLIVTGVNVGEPASDERWPDGEEATEKFVNCKAEAWWKARECFKRTHEMVCFLEGTGGFERPIDELISLPDDYHNQLVTILCQQLSQVKWLRNEKGKILIESKASLSKRGVGSPDFADALILTFAGYNKAEKWAAFARVRV